MSKCLPGGRHCAADKGILPFLLFGKVTKTRFFAGSVNALRQLLKSRVAYLFA